MRAVQFVSIGVFAAMAGPAFAADTPGPPPDVSFLRSGYIHFGIGAVRQADEGTLTLGGLPVAGADYATPIVATPTIEAGLYVTPHFSIAASGTLPMTFPNTGAGSLAAIGTLGTETVGFYALTAKAHLRGTVSPYVGAGVGYMHVFGTSDGAITGLAIQSAAGAVVQAGVDVQLTDRMGAFLDLKKFVIGTTASGTFMALPVVATTRVDPIILSAGLSVAF